MSFQFYQKDGHENAVDEHRREPVLMDVDNEGYPLADTIDFDSYLDFKPSEKPKTSKAPKKEATSSAGPPNYYKKHGDDVKSHFFYLVYETGLTAGKAGQQLGIARRTAYDWLKKDQKKFLERIEPVNHIEIENKAPKKKAGKPALLGEEHKKHLEDKFIDHPSATLDQAMESLTSQFSDLKVSKTTVYNFMTKNALYHSKRLIFIQRKKLTCKHSEKI
ncbi:hypothetical protein CU098_007964 [Rhizopus stolonifer]|uniref:Uncharacterized protein n=1 Tax=Rhizopus stolonifer TaxID=4846 RepID=A0A367JPZ9_RHIST|nr:hypothetical protein CU098_007964 [Rhizopus stolonifer]